MLKGSLEEVDHSLEARITVNAKAKPSSPETRKAPAPHPKALNYTEPRKPQTLKPLALMSMF